MFEPSLSDLPDSLTKAEFLARVGDREHERLDFKRELSRDDQKHVAAMAMTDGGLIVVGVDDPKRGHVLLGWPLNDEHRTLVMRLGRDIGVDVLPREIDVDGTAITVVAVPAVQDRIVTTSSGRLMRRSGSESIPLLGDDVARFVRERSTVPAVMDELLFDEDLIDWEVVEGVLSTAGRDMPDERFRALVDLGVGFEKPGDPRGRVMLLAAALLFGKEPTRFVPGAHVLFVRRRGRAGVDAPVSRREDVRGPLLTVADHVVDLLLDELPSFEIVTGRRRERVPSIDEEALREVVLNALAHRDYGIAHTTVDVLVTDDSLQVRSPGGLPGHITLENILREHYPRNKVLMEVLAVANLVETFGDGVDRIYDTMARRLLPEPLYEATQASVSVTLVTTSTLSIEDQVWLDTLGDVARDRDDRVVLLATRHKGAIARRDVRDLPIEQDAGNLLQSLVSRRLLEPRGRRGGRTYVLSAEVRARTGDGSIARERRRRDLIREELIRRGPAGVATREIADLLGDAELRFAREILNDLVRAGEARAEGKTAARRYYAET